MLEASWKSRWRGCSRRPRPGTFNPTDREQEVLQWRDWYWTVKQYLVVVDCAFQDELEKLEYNLTTEVDWELLDEGEQHCIVCWEASYRDG